MRSIGNYTVKKALGSGTMATVYLGTHRVTKQDMAIKIILKNHRHKQRFIYEAETLSRIAHPNIIRIYEIGESKNFFYYSMELYEKSLTDCLDIGPWDKNTTAQKFSLQEKFMVLADVLRAIDHLHELGKCHRDVCPNNILINANNRACLCDLGMGGHALVDSKDLLDSSKGNPKLYGAPEQDEGLNQAGTPADIYSFSVVAYQLFSRVLPKGNEIKPINTLVSALPAEISIMIMRGLSPIPSQRPTAREILNIYLKHIEGQKLPERNQKISDEQQALKGFFGECRIVPRPRDINEVEMTIRICAKEYDFYGIACKATSISDLQDHLVSLAKVRFAIVNPANDVVIKEVASLLEKSTEDVLYDLNKSIENIMSMRKRNPAIEIRYIDHVPAWRIVLIDMKQALIRTYKGNRRPIDSPMFCVDESSYTEGCLRLFDYLWENAKLAK
jgi:serine/threonine protein kinase